MKLIRRKRTRSGVVLFSVAALALAMTGILYAHWTDTLDAFVNVQTGTFGVEWGNASTDDDGLVNDPGFIKDDDGLTWPQVYDRWGESSSSDPAAPFAADRYDKDVGHCFTFFDTVNPDQLQLLAFNTYPSYYCSLFTSAVNTETVPAKASFLNLTVRAGEPGFEETVDPSLIVPIAEGKIGIINPAYVEGVDDSAFKYQVVLDITEGIRCGTQIDPGEERSVSGWFHVEQGASQNYNYAFNIDQTFMNWNEWDASFCSEGSIVANADGEPIGIANGTPDPLPLP